MANESQPQGWRVEGQAIPSTEWQSPEAAAEFVSGLIHDAFKAVIFQQATARDVVRLHLAGYGFDLRDNDEIFAEGQSVGRFGGAEFSDNGIDWKCQPHEAVEFITVRVKVGNNAKTDR